MKRKGATLVELTVVAVIGVVFFLTGLAFFLSTQRAVSRAVLRARLVGEAREALHWLGRDVRSARAIRVDKRKVELILPQGRVVYRLLGGGLSRGGRKLAPHLRRAKFSLRTAKRGKLLRVRLRLAAGSGKDRVALEVMTAFFARNAGKGAGM